MSDLQKSFTTFEVPGLPDGHPLTLRPKFNMSSGTHEKECELMGHRVTDSGVQIIVILPATPEVFERHIRIKDAQPSGNPSRPF